MSSDLKSLFIVSNRRFVTAWNVRPTLSPLINFNFVYLSIQSSQGISVGAGQYAPTIVGGQPRPIGIALQPMPLRGGPDMHGYLEDEETTRIRTGRASRAAGWSIEFSKKRAFEETFASLCV